MTMKLVIFALAISTLGLCQDGKFTVQPVACWGHGNVVVEYDPGLGGYYKVVLSYVPGEYLVSVNASVAIVKVTEETGSLEVKVRDAKAGDPVFVALRGRTQKFLFPLKPAEGCSPDCVYFVGKIAGKPFR